MEFRTLNSLELGAADVGGGEPGGGGGSFWEGLPPWGGSEPGLSRVSLLHICAPRSLWPKGRRV